MVRYEQLIEELLDGVPGQKDLLSMQLLFKEYANMKLKVMFYGNFEKFIEEHPRLMWMSHQLQQAIRHKHLGESFWLKKMQQFKFIRQELGIEIID